MIAIGSSWDPFERIKETVDSLRYLNSLNTFETTHFADCEFTRPVSIVPNGEEIDGYTHNGETYFPLTRADLGDSPKDSSEKADMVAI